MRNWSPATDAPPASQRVEPALLDHIRKRVGELTVNVQAVPELTRHENGDEYTQRGDIYLNLHPDRLEFVNPGRLPIGVTPQNILHESRPPQRRARAHHSTTSS